MDESNAIKMQALRELLEREEYEIDPHKVADAIITRLMTRAGDQCSKPRQ